MLHHSLSKNRLRLSWAKHKISFIGVGDDVNIIGEVNTCPQIFKSFMFHHSVSFKEEPIADITLNRVYVLCFSSLYHIHIDIFIIIIVMHLKKGLLSI